MYNLFNRRKQTFDWNIFLYIEKIGGLLNPQQGKFHQML